MTYDMPAIQFGKETTADTLTCVLNALSTWSMSVTRNDGSVVEGSVRVGHLDDVPGVYVSRTSWQDDSDKNAPPTDHPAFVPLDDAHHITIL